MGADQVAAIRPALNELLQTAENNEPGAGDLCASFTVAEQDAIWVQVLLGTITIGYPSHQEPLAFLHAAGISTLSGLVVESWNPGIYATLTHEPCSSTAVAQFIDQFLVKLHALAPEEYEIDVELQRLNS